MVAENIFVQRPANQPVGDRATRRVPQRSSDVRVSLRRVLCAFLLGACGTEAAPWEPVITTPPERRTPLVDAGMGPGQETAPPMAGTSASGPVLWPEGGYAAPPPPPPITAGATAQGGAGIVVTETAGTPAPPPAPPPPSVFRVTELFLRDPHVFVTAIDVTDTPLLGMSINRTAIPSQLTMDRDGDGMFDQSTLLFLQPFDPRVPEGSLRVIDGRCPVGGGPCSGVPASLDASWQVANRLEGSCLSPVAGTTGDYRTPITEPAAPCFATTMGSDLTMNFGGTPLEITDVQVSATYQATPQQLIGGLFFGYVTDAVAMRAILPSDGGLPTAGTPLSNYIRAIDKDNDESPNGQPGFWIYFNFVAKPVAYTE